VKSDYDEPLNGLRQHRDQARARIRWIGQSNGSRLWGSAVVCDLYDGLFNDIVRINRLNKEESLWTGSYLA
jgi:L-aminopeptidase/D-esterase-like protein